MPGRRCATLTTRAQSGCNTARGYRYPHDSPGGVVEQQYPPDEVVGRDYYRPSDRGAERAAAERLAALRATVRGGNDDEER